MALRTVDQQIELLGESAGLDRALVGARVAGGRAGPLAVDSLGEQDDVSGSRYERRHLDDVARIEAVHIGEARASKEREDGCGDARSGPCPDAGEQNGNGERQKRRVIAEPGLQGKAQQGGYPRQGQSCRYPPRESAGDNRIHRPKSPPHRLPPPPGPEGPVRPVLLRHHHNLVYHARKWLDILV